VAAAWRPTVGAGLARTLGRTNANLHLPAACIAPSITSRIVESWASAVRLWSAYVPRSLHGRVAAVTWTLLCLGVLAFGYVQREIHDMPVAFVWLMLILSFPLGGFGVLVAGVAWGSLIDSLGLTYQPFRDELPVWLFAFVVGYWQWFVLVPRFARWLSSNRSKSAA